MANFATTDVTYTVKNLRRLGNSKVHNRISLAFGNSTITYATGGVPLSIGKLGCPNTVESLVIVDKGSSGYEFMYDSTNNKLLMFQTGSSGTHTHALFLANADQADGATFRVNANQNKLGANTGTSLTVTGVTNMTASGGIMQATAVAAQAMSEPNTVAVAAQTVIVEVIGW